MSPESYASRRSEIRSGDLLFLREDGFWPWLIRTMTHGPYAHCGVAWVTSGRVMMLEARPFNGVTLRMASHALPFTWVQTNCEWSESVETHALSHLQEPYDFLDAVRLGLGWSPSRTGAVCSTYAADVLNVWLERVGFPLQRDGLSPSHLFNLFERAGARSVALY